MPLFSVIIPVYNAEASLLEALVSVEKQTHQDFETIIVNDGSTDQSKNIIQQWIDKNPQLVIKLVEQDNSGLGATRNKAIKMANGDYVCFLDADDVWSKRKLNVLADFLAGQSYNFIYHPVKSFGINKPRNRFCYPIPSLEELIVKGNPIVPSAVCINTELAKKHFFSTDSKYHGTEDLLLWTQLINVGHLPVYLKQHLTHYREDGGMSTKLKEHYQHVFNVFDQLQSLEVIDEKTVDAAMKRKNYEAARFYQKRKHFALAESYYKESKRYSLKSWFLRFANFLGLSI